VEDGLVHDEVWAVESTADGSIWAGTRKGLSRLKNGRFTTYSKANGLSDDWVHSICNDRNGGLWIGTDKGLNHLKAQDRATIYALPDFRNTPVQSILVDHNSVVWIGTRSEGLRRMQRGRIDSYSAAQGCLTTWCGAFLRIGKGICGLERAVEG
jgi:ligand-binding sensor domain-containing protein